MTLRINESCSGFSSLRARMRELRNASQAETEELAESILDAKVEPAL